ncbi:UDP-glycosyltransferase 79B6 [Capsicum galapagoense]
MAESIQDRKLHIVMFPWLAFGHLIPYINLSNELAKRGHKISFLLPKRAGIRLQNLNLYPHLITFHKLTIPHVDGLPYGAETTADVPGSLETLLATAMDELYDEIKSFLENLKPHFTVFYLNVCPAAAHLPPDKTTFMTSTAAELVKPPPGCDAIALKTCREIEGTFGDFAATQSEKPVLYTGPVLPEPKNESLEEPGLSNWLQKFEPGSVVFCAFGSQTILEKKQFQEIVLGLEMTELPFLLVVKPPEGTNSVEEALPEGFKERVKEKGLILDCWVPQLKILRHQSVGCFVSHCGYGSMWESLALCDCQLVFLPRPPDHLLNARLMEHELKVGVEVEKDENDLFTKENLCKAVKCVMDKDSQIACSMKENHRKWKELLSSPGFKSNYIDNFILNLHGLLD